MTIMTNKKPGSLLKSLGFGLNEKNIGDDAGLTPVVNNISFYDIFHPIYYMVMAHPNFIYDLVGQSIPVSFPYITDPDDDVLNTDKYDHSVRYKENGKYKRFNINYEYEDAIYFGERVFNRLRDRKKQSHLKITIYKIPDQYHLVDYYSKSSKTLIFAMPKHHLPKEIEQYRIHRNPEIENLSDDILDAFIREYVRY